VKARHLVAGSPVPVDVDPAGGFLATTALERLHGR
jgi:hypothetical protein